MQKEMYHVQERGEGVCAPGAPTGVLTPMYLVQCYDTHECTTLSHKFVYQHYSYIVYRSLNYEVKENYSQIQVFRRDLVSVERN